MFKPVMTNGRPIIPDWANRLPTVVTPRGRHVYFRSDCHAFADLGDGEYRGDGHYCLLPPSRHPSGATYIWLVPLPDGPIPFVADVRATGLFPPSCYTEDAENTSNVYSVCAVSSVSSVSSVYQEEAEQERATSERIERMIRDCLPTGPGRRNRQVFQLARAIKAIPELADAGDDVLRPIVKRWHALALPYIETKDFSETWIDFLQGWPKVKIPKGVTMNAIMQKALESPLPQVAKRYEEEPIRRLVALCRQLGQADGRTFFLSCRTAGGLLEVSHVQANRWLFLLAHDGVVEQTNQGDRGKRQAAEYRYLGD